MRNYLDLNKNIFQLKEKLTVCNSLKYGCFCHESKICRTVLNEKI